METSKEEKDLKPIWLYIGFQIIFSFVMGFLIGTVAKTKGFDPAVLLRSKKFTYVITLTSSMFCFIVFVLVYGKKLLSDIKRINKKTFLILLIVIVIMIVSNQLICEIFKMFGVEMKNQEMFEDMLKHYPISTTLVTLTAAFVEEMVFRYSLRTIFKNKILFVIVSSVIFGVLHGIGIVTILYTLIGLLLAIIYIKTNENTAATTIVHFMNNLYSIILVVLG